MNIPLLRVDRIGEEIIAMILNGEEIETLRLTEGQMEVIELVMRTFAKGEYRGD